jgi:hypothetical protein
VSVEWASCVALAIVDRKAALVSHPIARQIQIPLEAAILCALNLAAVTRKSKQLIQQRRPSLLLALRCE